MKKFTKISAILLAFAIALSLAGCKATPKELALTDREGKEITFPTEVKTIISLAPSTTQVLIDLGLEDKLAAVDKYSAPLLKEGNALPNFDIMHPDAEQLANLKVDVIFATGMSKADGEDPLKLLKDMGAIVTYIPTSKSISEIEKDVAFIAEVTGTADKGKALVDNMKAEIEKYSEIGKSITEKKTVYFEIGAAPKMYSFGKDVFLNEIIELIGGVNILESESGWISVAAEAVVAANPDVIMTNVNYLDDPIGEIKGRPGFEGVDAVKNNAVFAIDKNTSSYSNHNIVKAIKEMAEALYPEQYIGK